MQEGIKVYVDKPLENVDEGDRIGRVYVKGNNIDGWLDLFVENVSSTIIASTQDEKVRINGLNALEYCSVYTSLEDENLRIYAIDLDYETI